jgi:hypothetical protein
MRRYLPDALSSRRATVILGCGGVKLSHRERRRKREKCAARFAFVE